MELDRVGVIRVSNAMLSLWASLNPQSSLWVCPCAPCSVIISLSLSHTKSLDWCSQCDQHKCVRCEAHSCWVMRWAWGVSAQDIEIYTHFALFGEDQLKDMLSLALSGQLIDSCNCQVWSIKSTDKGVNKEINATERMMLTLSHTQRTPKRKCVRRERWTKLVRPHSIT